MASLTLNNSVKNNGKAPLLSFELLVQMEVKNKVNENDLNEVVYAYNNLSSTYLPYKTITLEEIDAARVVPSLVVNGIKFNDVIHAIRRDELINPNFVVIRDPFTIDFNVFRFPYSENACEADIRVYNLSEKTRFKIQKLRQLSVPFRVVELRAGVKKSDSQQLPILAKGYLLKAYSEKARTDVVTNFHIMGNSDMLTMAEAARNEFLPVLTAQGTKEDFLEAVQKNLPEGKVGKGKGAKSDLKGLPSPDRKVTVTGELLGFVNTFVPEESKLVVDNLEAFFYKDSDFRVGGLNEPIDVDHGLMSAPIIEENRIMITMMFEPRYIMLQQVKLVSFTYPGYFEKGLFKIIGIEHTGMISGAVNGQVITKLTLLMDNGTFESISSLDLEAFAQWDHLAKQSGQRIFF